jgi:hypothetical protein
MGSRWSTGGMVSNMVLRSVYSGSRMKWVSGKFLDLLLFLLTNPFRMEKKAANQRKIVTEPLCTNAQGAKSKASPLPSGIMLSSARN